MKRKNRCNRYMRGRIDLSNKDLVKSRCKLCVAVLLFIIGLYFSITWINWDAAVIFHNPTEADINHGTIEVDDVTLLSERWKEKRSYMYDVFTENCEANQYDVITNLNIRILGQYVSDSIVFLCESRRMLVNMRIEPDKEGTRLVCNETYGDLWKVEDERYHPLKYSFITEDDIVREDHTTTTYEETCMLYQAEELLKGEWKPQSI